MRFTPVFLALIALACSLVPGVHGAPAVPDHEDLVVRQDLGTVISGVVSELTDAVQNLLGATPPSLAEEQAIQQVVQSLENALTNPTGLIPRAIPPSFGPSLATSTASPTTRSSFSTTTTTTTSVGLPAGTQALQPPLRRQSSPSSGSVPAASSSAVCPLGALQPLQSILSVASSKLESLKPAASKPTGTSSSSAGRAR